MRRRASNTAHLAALGCYAIGVDIVEQQLRDARARWGAGEQLRWARSDALAFLAGHRGSLHAVASVFGAVYFTDPDALLPAVYDALAPGGRLVFSQPPPPGDSPGRRDSLRSTDGATVRILPRWDYPPGTWRELLVRHGYQCLAATVLCPPSGSDGVGTMLVHARKTTVG